MESASYTRGGHAIMSKVITISREFGSGGREIGFRLSEKLLNTYWKFTSCGAIFISHIGTVLSVL